MKSQYSRSPHSASLEHTVGSTVPEVAPPPPPLTSLPPSPPAPESSESGKQMVASPLWHMEGSSGKAQRVACSARVQSPTSWHAWLHTPHTQSRAPHSSLVEHVFNQFVSVLDLPSVSPQPKLATLQPTDNTATHFRTKALLFISLLLR